MNADQLLLIVASALLNGLFAALALYVGFTRGSGKTVDIALDKIERRSKESPALQRFLKVIEMTDKLFGDEQTIEQITRFFKEAGDLVSSPEAKNFFKNVTELMKQLGEIGGEKEMIKVPQKPQS